MNLQVTSEDLAARLIRLASEGRIELASGCYETAGFYIDIHNAMTAEELRRTNDLITEGRLHVGPRLGPQSARRVIEAKPSGCIFLNDPEVTA